MAAELFHCRPRKVTPDGEISLFGASRLAQTASAALMCILLAVSSLFAIKDLVGVLPGLQSIVALIPVAFAGIYIWNIEHPRNTRHFLGLATVLLVASLAWVLLVPTEPVSDFATYHRFGEIFSHFEPLPFNVRERSINMTMQPWGYPFTLALLYAVVGQSLIAAKLLNVVVGALTLCLLHRLGTQVVGPLAGRVAAGLFLFWPAHLTLTSVLASEHLALVALVAAFVVLLPVNDASGKVLRRTISAGALFGLATTFRYPCLIVLLAVLACVTLSNMPAVVRVWRASALAAGFLTMFGLYTMALHAIYGQAPKPSHNTLNLLFGANHASLGQWNEEDSSKRKRKHPAVDCQRACHHRTSCGDGNLAAPPLCGYANHSDSRLTLSHAADAISGHRY